MGLTVGWERHPECNQGVWSLLLSIQEPMPSRYDPKSTIPNSGGSAIGSGGEWYTKNKKLSLGDKKMKRKGRGKGFFRYKHIINAKWLWLWQTQQRPSPCAFSPNLPMLAWIQVHLMQAPSISKLSDPQYHTGQDSRFNWTHWRQWLAHIDWPIQLINLTSMYKVRSCPHGLTSNRHVSGSRTYPVERIKCCMIIQCRTKTEEIWDF